ncbi:hypothetical protein JX265_004398 [Neoarthrinium moseri]|uniref:RGS domain-containing protein n=1 Tax=Neoarthrinium moseri TaxID=1658444 RepID=A0A9Q0AR74_9PEZI|nr:uncharacterized protein JN550_001811 [Neoarthrinium moseri]KAI1875340.1 hypothetical protein JX265_004398 [Neoarthrinium moseri]KAI1875525.1 hypothetical protein JN550_001811 [Neoarthrinium moseri]
MTLRPMSPSAAGNMRPQASQDSSSDRRASINTLDTFGYTRESSDDDDFGSVIPESGTALTIDSRQHPYRASEVVDPGRDSPPRPAGRQLNQRSTAKPGALPEPSTIKGNEESKFGDVPSALTMDFSDPESSAFHLESRSNRPSARDSALNPTKQLSRTVGEGNSGSSSDDGHRGVGGDERVRKTTAAEIESARKILAQARLSDYESFQGSWKASVRGDRSASPPLTRQVRSGTGKESDSDDTVHSLMSPTPKTVEYPSETQQPPSVSRRHSHSSVESYRSHPSSKARSQHTTTRAPVAEHSRKIKEPEFLSRKDPIRTSEEVRGEETFPSSNFHRETNDGSGTTRLGSLTTSVRSHRAASMVKKILSNDGHSISPRLPADLRTNLGNDSSNRLPDFFNYEFFQFVLRNPTTAHQLLKFSQTRVCSENIEFLNRVDEYYKALADITSALSVIYKGYISMQSTNQLDVPEEMSRLVHKDIRSLTGKTLPGMETLFTDMQERVEEIVFTDLYPWFVQHQLALSASQALASDRHRYAGLGDCFCLTTPSKADNPITFASDGFVKVTGYGRPEIIPRNCRFLQGLRTDRVAIKRLKQGIDKCHESVELILNYKKNGDPFWNLLYVAPLYDQNGNLAFFIGGQVNCSTTIHTNADLLKVMSLSASNEIGDEEISGASTQVNQKLTTAPSAKKAFLKAFGVRSEEARILPGPSGMEHEVLNRMEGQNLNTQMKEFYTAYSKYLVIEANTFIIRYYSEGVMDALNPANNTNTPAGQDVFRFLKQNVSGKETDYRNKVRTAIRTGTAISVELRLQTRRSARFCGHEVFATHWTPLKDENASTHWVVITLASKTQ